MAPLLIQLATDSTLRKAPPAVLGEYRGKGLHHAQHPEDIRLELLTGGFTGLRFEQTTRPSNPRIVDDEGNVSAVSRGVGHVLIRGDVEFYWDDPWGGNGGWAASAGIDLACTERQRHFGEGKSDAAIGTGDEHDGILEFHVQVLSMSSTAILSQSPRPHGPRPTNRSEPGAAGHSSDVDERIDHQRDALRDEDGCQAMAPSQCQSAA
jgi:hypothetical protein